MKNPATIQKRINNLMISLTLTNNPKRELMIEREIASLERDLERLTKRTEQHREDAA